MGDGKCDGVHKRVGSESITKGWCPDTTLEKAALATAQWEVVRAAAAGIQALGRVGRTPVVAGEDQHGIVPLRRRSDGIG